MVDFDVCHVCKIAHTQNRHEQNVAQKKLMNKKIILRAMRIFPENLDTVEQQNNIYSKIWKRFL